MNPRHAQILEIIKEKKFVSVSALSQVLYTSESTVRRDLIVLEKNGLIQRTRGGAIYMEATKLEWPLMFKRQANMEKKQRIADLAADFIKDHQTIFIDSSSTCMILAKRLMEKTNLTLLTNGIMTASILSEATDFNIYCTCGKVYSRRSSIGGVDACEYISRFSADAAFVSCRGIAADMGVTDFDADASTVKRTHRKYTRKLILLADSTKFGQTFFHRTFDFPEVDIVISDCEFPADIKRRFQQSGTELISPGV